MAEKGGPIEGHYRPKKLGKIGEKKYGQALQKKITFSSSWNRTLRLGRRCWVRGYLRYSPENKSDRSSGAKTRSRGRGRLRPWEEERKILKHKAPWGFKRKTEAVPQEKGMEKNKGGWVHL